MSACSACGREVREQDRFCKSCGAAQTSGGTELSGKKARVMEQEHAWKKPLAIAAAVIVLFGGLWFAKGTIMKLKMGNRPMFAPLRDASARLAHAESIKSDTGDVRIPLSMLDDGNAHFFAYATGGKTVTFFAMKAMDGTIRTAYDACVACNHAKLGYRQEGALVVCNNCGMGFKPMDIGMASGGCNPIVLNKTVDGQFIVLKTKDLDAGTQYF